VTNIPVSELKPRLLHVAPFDPAFRCADEGERDTLGCGEFYREDAVAYHDLRLGRSIVLLHGRTVVTYATLSMGHLASQDFFESDGDFVGASLETDFYPAMHLLRIAVREGVEGMGVGSYLLDWCFTLAWALSHYLGCMFMMLETDEEHLGWYTEVNDFINFKTERDPRTGELVYWCRKRILGEEPSAWDESILRNMLRELESEV
jgi:GNAT superfamily N-acetyltransferase